MSPKNAQAIAPAWTTTSTAQLARLHYNGSEIADGNIANALLYRGDTRSLIENAQDLIMIVDHECVMRYHSPSLERLLGFSHAELSGRNGLELVHPDDLPEVVETFVALVSRPGGTVLKEYRVATEDGGWKLLETRGKNLLHDPVVVRDQDRLLLRHTQTLDPHPPCCPVPAGRGAASAPLTRTNPVRTRKCCPCPIRSQA